MFIDLIISIINDKLNNNMYFNFFGKLKNNNWKICNFKYEI